MVDEPDSNRRPTAFAVALPLSYRPLSKHRLATRGIRGGKAVRTGREFKNPYRCKSSIDVSHWRLAAPIRYATAPCCRPYRSIQARRFRAFAAFPASDQHCPDASGRDAIAFGLSGVSRFANRKNKTPPVLDRGRSLASGDRGDRPPAYRRSIDGIGFVAIAAQRRRERAQAVTGWPQRVQLGDVVEVRHGRRDQKNAHAGAKVAHVTPMLLRMQRPFVGTRTVATQGDHIDDRAQRSNGASAVHT